MADRLIETCAPAFLCETHGAVVGFVPFAYIEEGVLNPSGPFCMLCISAWYDATFPKLKPLPNTGASRA